MVKIYVILDNQLTLGIDIKEEYSQNEFIDVFENLVVEVKKHSGTPHSALKNKANTPFVTNSLFDALDARIREFSGLTHEDHKTMRAYQFEKKVKGGQGFIWIAPRSKSLWVYFKKMNLTTADKEKRVIDDGSTWGQYPLMKVHDQKDLKYAYEIAEAIYKYYQLHSS